MHVKVNKQRIMKSEYDDRNCRHCVFNSACASTGWIIDTGATSHRTDNRHFISELDMNHHSDVGVANEEIINAEGTGSFDITLQATLGSPTKLNFVLWVPALGESPLSIRKLVEDGIVQSLNRKYRVLAQKENECKVISEVKESHYRISKAIRNEQESVLKTEEMEEEEEHIQPESDDAILTFRKQSNSLFCRSINPDGTLVVTGGDNDEAFVWEMDTGEVVHEITEHKDNIITAEFSYDGTFLATGHIVVEIKVFKLEKAHTKIWDDSSGGMSRMKWQRKANVLFVISEEGEIYICRVPFGECKVLQGSGDKCEIAVFTRKSCVHQWHRRLAHRNLDETRLRKKHGLKIEKTDGFVICEHCLIGEMARLPFPKESKPVKHALDIIVSDVCDAFEVESIGRKRYCVTFIDVYSGPCEHKFIKEKTDVADVTINYVEYLKTQYGRKPKREGIKLELSVGYCPEQNGIAEHRIRTLGEAARCMFSEANLPLSFWARAVNMANHTQNRIIKRKKNKTTYEMFYNEVKGFGFEACVVIPEEMRRKLDQKSIRIRFKEFVLKKKGYRMTDGRKVIVSREAHFLSEENDPKGKLSKPDKKKIAAVIEVTPTQEQIVLQMCR